MFKLIPSALVVLSLCLFSMLAGQIPDYDLGEWAGSRFDSKTDNFFRALTLQTSHHHFHLDSSGDRFVLDGHIAATSSFTDSDLRPVTGKSGLLPLFEGNFLVTANLSLNGAFSGFSASGDAVIVNRYGADLLLGESWLLGVQRCRLVGPDDFFLKTVVVTIIRRINYRRGNYAVGVSSGSYRAGVHIKGDTVQGPISRIVRGGITPVLVGLDRDVGSDYGIHMEARIHPSFVSLMLGVSRTLR